MRSTLYFYNGELQTLVSAPGAGYYYTLSAEQHLLGFKWREVPGGPEAPALLDLKSGEITLLHAPVDRAGQVSFTNRGDHAFTIGDSLFVGKAGEYMSYDLGTYANLTPVAPDGKRVVYNDRSDRLWILGLEDGERCAISEGGYGSVLPSWSPDSGYVAYHVLNGDRKIYDTFEDKTFHAGKAQICAGPGCPASSPIPGSRWMKRRDRQYGCRGKGCQREHPVQHRKPRCDGTNPAFSADGSPLYMRNGKAVKSSVDKRVKKDSGEAGGPGGLPVDPVYFEQKSPRQTAISTSPMSTRSTTRRGREATAAVRPRRRQWSWPITICCPPGLSVPGSGTGTTTAPMFTNAMITTPTPLTWITGTATRPGRAATPATADGIHVDGREPSSKDARLLRETRHERLPELEYQLEHGRRRDRQKGPVLDLQLPFGQRCTCIAAAGRVENGQRTVIVNDPYGDKNTANWPSYDGKAVYLRLAGIQSRGTSASMTPTVPIPACRGVLPRTFVQRRGLIPWWTTGNSRRGSTCTWTEMTCPCGITTAGIAATEGITGGPNTEADAADICHVTWTPQLDSSAYYEISAYIPGDAEAVSAYYRVQHAAGISVVAIDQSAAPDAWVSLGKFLFLDVERNHVSLGDSSATAGEVLVFDAVKWEAADPQELDLAVDQTVGMPDFPIRFSVVSSLPQGDYEYIWDFGDGSTGYGETTSHRYDAEGIYSIRLTARAGDAEISVLKENHIMVIRNLDGDFDLISPDSMEVVNTRTPLLFWETVENTEKYLLYIGEKLDISASAGNARADTCLSRPLRPFVRR
ncbi:MAG: PKD domain-containing protein [Candidatus Marinimicrobia bacterium]|nr:PKD domain-containing protein [Candidatus Neomarinimicrobiota bacterium]